MVGHAYHLRGRWDAAEELEVQVMETSKKKLGADHPSTLTSMANLASTYRNQGRWDAAEELEVQVMETSKKKLGADHPDTLTSMANLAATYRNQGRHTLTSMNNLAFTLKGQGLTNKAISLMENCCKLQAVVLGPQHPYTISSREALTTWRLEVRELSERNYS
ncbi:hypothetical protein DM02DRAFT_722456 [Periconia macrospinosa]|uniref:TPR-like protein n=1 Tax=Periconia macrospinosa TaxID=97972 RepID=A0A2V1D195_9PLEO|nr:hypothetical protein DM02DRAFT_722456 [Periconia macrospinosa]